MNFLAHVMLSPPNPELVLGGLLGDFVKGPLSAIDLPEQVCHGIWLHRKIDSFTDRHPLFLRSKRRVSNERRRYAGIMVDMFYDHLLARHWEQFHDQSLESFTRQLYRELEGRQELLPVQARTILLRMASEDWLSSYAELPSLHQALDNMSRRRLRPGNRLLGSVAELEDAYIGFEDDFLGFMPQVMDYAAACAESFAAD